MAKKVKKRDVDEELLESIFVLERRWKHIHSIMSKSIEPQEAGIYEEQIVRANYIFLLREARRRKISVIRYH